MGDVRRGRPPLAEQERRECVWTTRFTADEAEALTSVFKGMGLSRSDGLRALALLGAERRRGGRAGGTRRPRTPVRAADVVVEPLRGPVVVPEPELAVPAAVFREPARQCPPHPKARVLKGLCGACGRQVGSERVA